MKKIISILLIALVLTACSLKNSPTNKTREFLNRYQTLSEDVISDLELNAESENLGSNNTPTYIDAIKRNYQNLKYEITDERIDGNKAIVTANITVYDLYKSMKDSREYMEDNTSMFETNGVYDQNKFFEYELNEMLKTNEIVNYTISFNLEKKDNTWEVVEPSDIVKSKLHGIYNYEIDQ